MRYTQLFIGSVLMAGLFTACNNESKPAETTAATTPAAPAFKEETITYTGDGISMNGYVVYDDSNKNKRPAVLVVPEWWGLNDYPKMRAKQLAELG